MTRPTFADRRHLRLEALEARDVPAAAGPSAADHGPGPGCEEVVAPGMGPAEHVAWAISPSSAPAAPAASPAEAAPYAAADTFRLHSRPAATKKIFLDFDGHTTAGTPWNLNFNGSRPIVTPAYDFEGGAEVTAAEHARIQGVWQRVMEDFSPFDVDVTTEDPGLAGLTWSGAGDGAWGTRVVIGGDGAWLGPYGGVAYVSSFQKDFDITCYVFSANLADHAEKAVAEAVSHEVGHTLGLDHDGTASLGYYGGHAGNGTPGWAPIMGVGYYQGLVQWSKGEYPGARNRQLDIDIITNTAVNFGYRPDDYGSTLPAATPMAGPAINFAGVIERTADVDVVKFQAGPGRVTFDLEPWVNSPNLDIRAVLEDAGGRILAASYPAASLAASISATVPGSGTYYLIIEGVGAGNPAGSGYSDYGSLGQYTVSGTVPAFVAEDPPEVVSLTAVESAGGMVTAFRVGFNVPVNPKTLTAATAKVTGPAGAAVRVTGVRFTSPTDATLSVTPQRFAGAGGVRVALSPAVRSKSAGNPLDTDGDAVPGELDDYFAGAAYQFNATAGGPITDDGVPTDFPLAVGRAFDVRDVNVRVNVTHDTVGDLDVRLVSPAGVEVRLFDNRGGTGNNLVARFDEQATKTLVGAKAPFSAAVYKPDFDGTTLAALNGASAAGEWKLRVTDAGAGVSGTLNSWGLTFATDDARDRVRVVAVTPVAESPASVAKLVKSFTVQFDRPVNPATVRTTDFRVTNPKGAGVPVVSVTGSGATFTVTTAAWTRAGEYTVTVGPRVADVIGNAMDGDGDGFFLEPADGHAEKKTLARNVYQSTRVLTIPDGRSLTSAVTVPDTIAINQIAVAVNIRHADVADLKLTLTSPAGDKYVLVSAGAATGSDFPHTTFTDEAAAALTGPGPHTGDYKPVTSMAGLVGDGARGTWKLTVEDAAGGDAGQFLSWGLYIKPTA